MTQKGHALRATSDSLLDDLDALATLEAEKRTVDPNDARIVDLSTRIEALARRVLEETTEERRLTVQMNRDAPTEDRAINRTSRSVSAVLDAWREAERALAGTVSGSPEADVAKAKVDRLRQEYREAFEARDRR